MNSKQTRTLESIFTDPIKSDIKWKDIESLFEALGGEIEERSGSRVSFVIDGLSKTFHRPHPSPNTKTYAVKAVRNLLMDAGITRKGRVNDD
ncbi:MAG: type II toxin-antitoxin system HicA family toxin [Cyanobacteria bacterium J06639_1]